MRIVYFGTYSSGAGYPRSRVLIKALRSAGADVVECHAPVGRGPAERPEALTGPRGRISLLARTAAAHVRLARSIRRTGPFDLLIVGCAGQADVLTARALVRNKPIVLDAFISLHDTIVNERRLVSPSSPGARLLWHLDRIACRIADAVILDTDAHIDHFVRTFGHPRDKFIRAWVGEDDAIFRPGPEPARDRGFEVLFFGTYLGLHGTEHIVRAAGLLENDPEIRFTLVGNGPAHGAAASLAADLGCANIEFIGRWADYGELIDRIAGADACLGIFGTGPKAGRVIPCKVFGALAMGRPVITRRSPAAEELLEHGRTALLCEPGDAEAIASTLRRLRSEPALGERLGRAGLRLFRRACAPAAIGPGLLEALERVKRGERPR